MRNPRKVHAGKTPNERKQYQTLLKSKSTLDPTSEAYESTSTDSVAGEDLDKTSTNPPTRKPYKQERTTSIRDIIVAVIGAILVIVFTVFAITLNREVGVLEERLKSMKSGLDDVETDYGVLRKELESVRIELEVLKQSRSETP